MKKLLPIILASIMLLCGCVVVNDSDNDIDFSSLTYNKVEKMYGKPAENSVDNIGNHIEFPNASIYTFACKADFWFVNDTFCKAHYTFTYEMTEDLLVALKNALKSKYGGDYKGAMPNIMWESEEYDLKVLLSPNFLIFERLSPKPVMTTVSETTVNKATLSKDYYETKSTTKSADSYEWTINTNSDGYDWNSVNDMEKDVWCSNSFAAWRLMGYDIPNDASQSELKRMIDAFYADEENCKVDITTVTESYAILKGIY